MKSVILDDSSPKDKSSRLEVYLDNQGDLYFSIVDENHAHSDTIRLCGPGGGSRYGGLAGQLKTILFPDGKPLTERII